MNILDENTKHKLIDQIVNIFEDFLAGKHISFPKAVNGTSEDMYIYGDSYDFLSERINAIIESKEATDTNKEPVITNIDTKDIINALCQLCGKLFDDYMLLDDNDKRYLTEKVIDTFENYEFTVKIIPTNVNEIDIKNSFTVAIENDGVRTPVYEFIRDIREAYVLAEYAMNHDRGYNDGIVVILPGYNIGVGSTYMDHDLTPLARKLAEQYKANP